MFLPFLLYILEYHYNSKMILCDLSQVLPLFFYLDIESHLFVLNYIFELCYNGS